MGANHDLRRRATQLAILAWIKTGWIRYVHFGTPCTVFSRARHNIRRNEKARERERVGVERGLFTAEAIHLCERYNVGWSLENPRGSRLFELPMLAPRLQQPHVYIVDVDYCQYGEPFKKPTRIYTNLRELIALGRTCNHRSHVEVLRGSERVFHQGKWTTAPKTRRAGAYPFQLVRTWAQAVRTLMSPVSFDSHRLVQQWDHELRLAAEKTAPTGQQVQPSAGWEFQLGKFEQACPGALSKIIFGQHTNQEVKARRRKLKKAIPQLTAEIPGLSHPESLGH